VLPFRRRGQAVGLIVRLAQPLAEGQHVRAALRRPRDGHLLVKTRLVPTVSTPEHLAALAECFRLVGGALNKEAELSDSDLIPPDKERCGDNGLCRGHAKLARGISTSFMPMGWLFAPAGGDAWPRPFGVLWPSSRRTERQRVTGQRPTRLGIVF